MTRRPDLFVTVKGSMALIRGWEAQRATSFVVCNAITCTADPDYAHECRPRWSDSGRGYVIAAVHVADVLAYGQSYRLLTVVSDVSKQKAS